MVVIGHWRLTKERREVEWVDWCLLMTTGWRTHGNDEMISFNRVVADVLMRGMHCTYGDMHIAHVHAVNSHGHKYEQLENRGRW